MNSHCNARGTDEHGAFIHTVKGTDWQMPATLRTSIIASAPEMLKLIRKLKNCPVSGSGALLTGNSIFEELNRVYRLAHGLPMESICGACCGIFEGEGKLCPTCDNHKWEREQDRRDCDYPDPNRQPEPHEEGYWK